MWLPTASASPLVDKEAADDLHEFLGMHQGETHVVAARKCKDPGAWEGRLEPPSLTCLEWPPPLLHPSQNGSPFFWIADDREEVGNLDTDCGRRHSSEIGSVGRPIRVPRCPTGRVRREEVERAVSVFLRVVPGVRLDRV